MIIFNNNIDIDLHDVIWLGHQGDVVRQANVCLLATIRMIFTQSLPEM